MSLPGSMFLLPLFFSPLLADKTPCKVCRDLTTSFKEHFDKTIGQNFGGGNTAWEEKSLGTYAKSETRLVEIIETASKAKDCDYKCSSLLENEEEYLEDWFFNRQDKTDLFEEMCVQRLARCCLKNRWGAECAECPGGTETPCSGHGSCHGEGDRSDESKTLHGTCTCDKGYTGTLCEECKSNFVRVGELCEECSSLCDGPCTAPGPAGCTQCVKGYELVDGTGCTDINECEGLGCGDPLEDCVNSVGSYECFCKSGYHRVGGKCQLEELYADEDEEDDPVESDDKPQVSEDTTESDHVDDTPQVSEDTTESDHVDDDDDEDDDEYDEVDEENKSETDTEGNVVGTDRYNNPEL